jgi:hypothetical protein
MRPIPSCVVGMTKRESSGPMAAGNKEEVAPVDGATDCAHAGFPNSKPRATHAPVYVNHFVRGWWSIDSLTADGFQESVESHFYRDARCMSGLQSDTVLISPFLQTTNAKVRARDALLNHRKGTRTMLTIRIKMPSAMFALLVLSACSGSPPAKETVAASSASTINPNVALAAPQASADPQKLTPERIMQLQHEGYKLVDRDGETYFCRTEAKTGSRLARETICMTEPEITRLREQTKQGLGRVMREQPPPQGN